MSEYKILSTIYTSSFITIYKAQNISSKKIYAIKKSIFPSKSHLEKWKKQINLLQILNYGHFFVGINLIPIIQYNIKKLDNMSYALYELMPLAEMDLDKKISYSKNILSQNKLIKILKQLINTLYYMQKNGIAHRDIKPGNIFEINDEYYIGDFDQSIKIERNNNNAIIEEEIKGSEAFMSPIIYEALIKNKKNLRHNIFKSDVYSFGLCFIYTLTKDLFVLQKIKEIKQNEKIKQFILDNLSEKKMELSQNFLDLITKMVIWDEKCRPDFIKLNDLINEKNYKF
jgi:serine/threonine protein kinase